MTTQKVENIAYFLRFFKN